MSRVDHEKTSYAKRAELRNRLVGEFQIESATADAWIKAWEIRAALAGIERGARYWNQAFEWIINEREPFLNPSRGALPAGWVETKGKEHDDRNNDDDLQASSDALPEPAPSPHPAHASRRRTANRLVTHTPGSPLKPLEPRSERR